MAVIWILALSFFPTVVLASVGQAILAVGEVGAWRNERLVPLRSGAAIENGDRLQVGPQSSLQIRFIDGALVAVRSNSILLIEDYRLGGNTVDEHAFLALLKGGLRTVTGLLGRASRNDYRMRTPTSVIGIRGTHYTLVYCNDDCSGTEDAPENGLYGGVSEGRIALSNEAGTREFSEDQYFFVASPSELPRLLLAPPKILRDPLDARANRRQNAPAVATSSTVTANSSSSDSTAGTSSSGSSSSTSGAATDATVTSDETTAGSGTTTSSATISVAATQSSATGAGGNTAASLVTAGPGTSGSSALTTTLTASPTPTLVAVQGSPIINVVQFTTSTDTAEVLVAASAFGVQSAEYRGAPRLAPDGSGRSLLDYRLDAASWSADRLSNDNFDPVTGLDVGRAVHYREQYVKTASADSGGIATLGNLHWGRYSLNATITNLDGPNAGLSFSSTSQRHWLSGDLPLTLPTSGSYVYHPVGGTLPTDRAGNLGTITNPGSISVNFEQRTLSTVVPIAWQMASGTDYTIAFSNAPLRKDSAQSVVGTDNRTYTQTPFIPIDATATSSCKPSCTLNSVLVAPALFGSDARGLGLGLATAAVVPAVPGGIERTAFVRVYAR